MMLVVITILLIRHGHELFGFVSAHRDDVQIRKIETHLQSAGAEATDWALEQAGGWSRQHRTTTEP